MHLWAESAISIFNDGPVFLEDSGFISKQENDNIYLVLFQEKDDNDNVRTFFYVVPTTFKNILKLNEKDCPQEITRLLNIVKKQFPNSEDYIDEILNTNI